MEIKCEISGVEETLKILNDRNANMACKNALNKTLTDVKKLVVSGIKERYNVIQKDLNLGIRKATPWRLEASLSLRSKKMKLSFFKPQWAGRQSQGASVAIKKSSGRKILSHTFWWPAKQQVWVRTVLEDPRSPIKPLSTISPATMGRQTIKANNLRQFAAEQLSINVKNAVQNRLTKLTED